MRRFAHLSVLLLIPTLAAAPLFARPQAPPAAAPQAAGAIFPFDVEQRTLENGLKIVAIPYDSPGIVSFYIVIRTGSRDEVEPGHSGFAHFFEHMMFRGTQRYPPGRYNDALKQLGADANAFTSDDRTVYHMTGPAGGFETMVEIEADRFQHLEYSEDAFRTEALAVLGEYNKSASNPFLALEERLRELAFTKHTYRHTTLGFLEDIQAMPGYYEYSLSFFNRFYRPDNATVIVVGDIQPERAFEVVSSQFGAWKRGYAPPRVETEPPQAERRTAHIEWPNPTRPYLMFGYHVPAFSTGTVDFPVLDVISELLFSRAAPLYREAVIENQWADFISGGAVDHRDPYLFTIAARAQSDAALESLTSAIDRHLARLQSEPVDAERLARTASHLRYQFALSMDTPDAIANRVSHYIALTGSVETINELFERYQEITPADVQRVARQTFRPQNETRVTLSSSAPREAR